MKRIISYICIVFLTISAIAINRPVQVHAAVNPVWPCDWNTANYITTLYYYSNGMHSTSFGYDKAIDIGGGGNIYAIDDGVITVKKSLGNKSYGNYIRIRHNDGSESIYGHLASFADGIALNVRVSRGQKIGVMGNTGNSSGVHLHFEYSAEQPVKMFLSRYAANIKFKAGIRTNNATHPNDANSKWILNKLDTEYNLVGGYYCYKGGSGSSTTPDTPAVEDTCNCSESYAGTYVVNTAHSNLYIRTDHGAGDPVGSIPKGKEVLVTKANGKWAHVIYNNIPGFCSMQYLKKVSDSGNVVLQTQGGKRYYASTNIYTSEGTISPTQEETPTNMTPECVVHIDKPHGEYDGSNHIEISGWIASQQDLTYVMCESDAFGQMNLSGNLSDASAELDGAGYSSYPFKKRFRSVIDRKYLQPNTTYYIKVWAGLSGGGSSAVCSQKFNVTSIAPTQISITGPSSSAFTAGKDVTISGTIMSLNPITDVTARLGDIAGSSQVVDFNVSLKAGSGNSVYTYGYTFSGTLPLSQVRSNNTTASVFVSAIDENNITYTKARTFTIGKVVQGDLGSYQFNFDQDFVRIYNSDSQTLSGTIYANAPIADVMAAIHQWSGANNDKQIQLGAALQEISPPAGFTYAKRFTMTVPAGELCKILDVDSFVDDEFHSVFWTDLVSDSGQGVHLQAANSPKIFGTNVTRPSFTVSYNANGGSGAPGVSTFKYGGGVTISSTIPTRVGYSFRGWTISAGSNQVKYVPGSTYSDNNSITLYAVWEKAAVIPTDLISYNFNAGITIKNAAKIYKFVPSATTKYRFTASGSAGANVVIQNASGNTVTSFSNSSNVVKEVILNHNQVYYVVVKPNTSNATGSVAVNVLRSYKVEFDADGGTNIPTDALYQFAGEALSLPESVPTHSPVTISFSYDDENSQIQKEYSVDFDKWANFDFGSYETWGPGECLVNNRPITLTALWKYHYLSDIEVDIPEKEGWYISCWKDADGNMIDFDETRVLEDATYYAVWSPLIPLEGIKVTPKKLNLDVGDKVQLVASQIPANAIMPEVVWESSNPDVALVTSDGEVDVLANGVSVITASTKNREFSDSAAIIVGSGEYTVTYDANGGDGAPESCKVSYGESFNVSDTTPFRTGFTFMGWTDSADNKEVLFQPGDALIIDRNRTLYAVWNPDTYVVSFDANGGTGTPDPQIKNHDEPLTLSEVIPERDGFAFAGWAEDASSIQAEYTPGGLFEANRETVLYAIWLDHAEGISLNYSTLAMEVGERKTLKASVTPDGAAGTAVKWFSSDEDIATVTNGTVTAVSAGEATVTCSVPENDSITASCRVRVAPQPILEGNLDAPVSDIYTARQGDNIHVDLQFVSLDAAYAKIVYSYDEKVLELISAEEKGDHVTLGNNIAVLAVGSGKIPDGTQAELTFRIKNSAESGLYPIDTAVVECYSINEENTRNFASAADAIRISCEEHTLEMIEPTAATRSADGLSAGWKCSVCGEVLTEQQVIKVNRCCWMPEALTTIEEEAFMGLSAQQVVVSQNTTSIGDRAFKDCEQLLLVVVPETVEEIGENVFEGSDQVVIITPKGSAAEKYAADHSIPYMAQ